MDFRDITNDGTVLNVEKLSNGSFSFSTIYYPKHLKDTTRVVSIHLNQEEVGKLISQLLSLTEINQVVDCKLMNDKEQETMKRKPFEWLTKDSRTFLQRGYLLPGVSAEERIREIADKFEEYAGEHYPGIGDKFYDYMSRGWISLSSPIWSNYGNDRGLPISCFGSYIPDSVEGIMETLSEVAVMSKHGGGTSGYFGAVRPRGSLITNNGKSDGSHAFARLYDTVIDVISQGTTRKGQFAGYIPIDHGDIEDWYNIRKEGDDIQLMYYGITVSNQWLEEMIAGDDRKRELWAELLQCRNENGIPYILFTDNANTNKPDVYIDNNMEIVASNLCFTGDTVVAVADGRNGVTIKQLAEESQGKVKFNVYSAKETYGDEFIWGEETKPAVAFKTGTKPVIKVNLSDGTSFKCTPDHPIALNSGEYIEAQDSIGESLVTYDITKSVVVVSIEDAGVEDVYDLTVEDNHNFYIFPSDESGFNDTGVLVHNCNEIMLPSSPEESFVCCLSSMNLIHYDEWKDTDAVKVASIFLDSVMEEFIEKSSKIKHFERAHRFAVRHRALGLGVLGWHSLLQSKMIPFDSFEAMQLNNEVFKFLRKEADKATEEMAEKFGEPELLKGYGRRNTTMLAIAPTKSSSFILGNASQGIEPIRANYAVQDLSKIKTIFKNPYLQKVLEKYGIDTEETWKSILDREGSVQHLDELTQTEKDVFKTFSEISQLSVIQQAGQRQRWVDHGQSLNLMIHPSTPTKDINKLVLTAWELGIKGLYYQHSINAAQKFNRSLIECESCSA